jgi:hypothetical protein
VRIYSVIGTEDAELCQPLRGDDYETISRLINGESRRKTWTPIAVRLIHSDEGRQLTESDSPWMGSNALVLRENACTALRAMLDANGELLPLLCRDASLWVFNPRRVLPALDESASSVVRFSSGRIMRIERYVFRPDVIGNADMFKISSLRVGPSWLRDEGILTGEEVVWVGDSTDFGLCMTAATLLECFPRLFSLPQHSYALPRDGSWCLNYVMEGELFFARAPENAVSRPSRRGP